MGDGVGSTRLAQAQTHEKNAPRTPAGDLPIIRAGPWSAGQGQERRSSAARLPPEIDDQQLIQMQQNP
ncbi:hypothetical protein AB0B45_17330 [Nonomuraea sp. NPDC049152]|uniref:hypothetical protein n=1 Tax=Nonomuraea sp. NPDC049152 TaxID=3154350 RepID=UPI0033E06C9F